MKRILSIIVVLVGLSFAQTAFAQMQVALGIKGGPNFANIDTKSSPGENYKNRTGYHARSICLV